MASQTHTQIANAALTRIGSTRRVHAITDDPDLDAIWEPTVRLLLAVHPWNFAIKRRRLNAGPVDDGPFLHSFALPEDCLRWLPPTPEDGEPIIQEGRLLFCDAAAPITVRYVSSDALYDCSLWSAQFAEAVTLAVAERLAEPVTQSRTLRDSMAELAALAMKAAKRADGLASNGGQPARQINVRSTWLQARGRSYRAPGR